MPDLTLLLVRHADPVPPGTAGHEENDRPLSGRGRRDAAALGEALALLPVAAVFASPYPRAVQTVEPLARRLGLPVAVLPGLRERLLSPGPLPDWRERLEAAWNDPDLALPGGESNRQAAARGLGAIGSIRATAPAGSTVVAASHGNLIALVLQALKPAVDFAFWAAMPMPAVYRLEHEHGRWRVVSGPGL